MYLMTKIKGLIDFTFNIKMYINGWLSDKKKKNIYEFFTCRKLYLYILYYNKHRGCF